jgi:hypothetical protein
MGEEELRKINWAASNSHPFEGVDELKSSHKNVTSRGKASSIGCGGGLKFRLLKCSFVEIL